MSISGLQKCRKVGVFGGTFDPVHDGHLRLAEFVLAGEIVEHILFLPAAQPPHKMAAAVSFSHRVNMLETVVAGQSAMTVSLLESRRHGPSYTVDSLKALQADLPAARLFFVLGADSLLELHLWYRFSEIFALADLIVVARSGLDDELCFQAIRALPSHFSPDKPPCFGSTTMTPLRCYENQWVALKNCVNRFSDKKYRVWTRGDGAGIWYLSGFSSPVSSSQIRHQLASGKRPHGVDPAVLTYIQTHNLYRGRNDHALYS